MRESGLLSLGGFIIGLGVGWYIFEAVSFTYQTFAWILIILGSAIIVSALVSRWNPGARGLVSALAGGLVLSLFLTSGLGFIRDFSSVGNWPFSAEDTKSFSGPVTVDKVYLNVESFNGPVEVSTWDKDEYSVKVRIQARGSSQADAEKRLRDLNVNFDDSLQQSERRISVKCEAPFGAQSRYVLEVKAFLPARATVGLDLKSTNGPISIEDLKGTTLKVSTTNAWLAFNGVRAETVEGSSTNGRIEGDVEAKNAVLSTSNGRITLSLPCTTSGEYKLRTSNAAIGLSVSESSKVGYDVDLSTSNANIDVNLPAMVYSRNDRTSKEARSEGFDAKAVQIVIEASTSNANINITTD